LHFAGSFLYLRLSFLGHKNRLHDGCEVGAGQALLESHTLRVALFPPRRKARQSAAASSNEQPLDWATYSAQDTGLLIAMSAGEVDAPRNANATIINVINVYPTTKTPKIQPRTAFSLLTINPFKSASARKVLFHKILARQSSFIRP